jgi:hypothetical protein
MIDKMHLYHCVSVHANKVSFQVLIINQKIDDLPLLEMIDFPTYTTFIMQKIRTFYFHYL